jgi:hypothetical protein
MAALRCQHCDQPLTTIDIQEGWCENCGKRIASGIMSAAAHHEYEVAPSRQGVSVPEVVVAKSRAFLGWGTVRAGLAQVFFGVLVLAIGVGLLLLLLQDLKTVRGRPSTGQQVAQFLTILLIGIGGILAAAGMSMGCAAPGDPGPKGWALGVTGCIALALVLLVLQRAFEIENTRVRLENRDREYSSIRFDTRGRRSVPEKKELPYSEKTMKALGYILEGIGWLGGILFLVFLRGTAASFRNAAQARHAVVYLVIFVVCGGGFVLLRVLDANGALPYNAEEIIRWTVLGVFGGLTLWYLVLVGLVRGTVTRALVS